MAEHSAAQLWEDVGQVLPVVALPSKQHGFVALVLMAPISNMNCWRLALAVCVVELEAGEYTLGLRGPLIGLQLSGGQADPTPPVDGPVVVVGGDDVLGGL